MDVVIKKYATFLFFTISLYLSSLENAFCYTAQGYFDEINRPTNHSSSYINSPIFNVLNYGAKGDGVTNDAKAFEKTWAAACKTRGGVMLIPAQRIFLLQPVTFEGSYCQPNIIVQVNGKIIAPNKSKYTKIDLYWILFEELTRGIQIEGNGIIDGNGASWWKGANNKAKSPHAVGIYKSANVVVTGITIQNSQRMHLYIGDCQYVKIYDFTIKSPESSPNTDGIHIATVQHADIYNSNLGCGDDCISIQTGCSNVKIYNVQCGPGHGYSIGGLGPKGEVAQVSDISITKSTVHNALNGVRIKTWPGGSGSVHNIIYSGIKMSNVKNPIVIDQDYCGGSKQCSIPNNKAVAVYNVSYKDIQGTYSYKPISLACSQFAPCKYLTFADISITSASANKPATPYCANAHGRLIGRIIPSLKNCFKIRK